MSIWKRAGLIAALGCATAWTGFAQVVRPTVSGTLQSSNNGYLLVRSETGTVWQAQLTPNGSCKWMGSNRSLSAIPKGSKVMMRVVGSLSEKPLKVDLVTDWGSSANYVATAAPAPYYTKKGDMAGPGGVGGKPDNGPDPGKAKNVGGYAVNGGMPSQHPQDIPNILAPKAQTHGVPQMQPGTPGFQQGPIPPAPTANPGTPGMHGMPGQQPAFDPSQPPAPTNPAAAAAGMPGTNMPGMYPGMNPYPNMDPGFSNGSSVNPLDSLLNSGEDGEMQQGGPSFPGMSMNQGSPVSLQATVLSSDPATRSMVVQAIGSQIPQNVVLGPQVMVPPLREGQTVMIQGTNTPQGWIEARSVTPFGQ